MNEITQADRDLLDALNNTPAFRNREELKAHKLQEIAKHRLAALRKLLEAKDAAVRANVQ